MRIRSIRPVGISSRYVAIELSAENWPDPEQSNFYEVADASSQGQRLENVFSTRSNVFHARYLKPYQKYFSMNTILGKEHLADNIVRSFCQQLETRFVSRDHAFDLADWIEFAAWDLDWEMTFSQDMGFLRSGTDVDGMIRTGEMIMRYLGCVGQIPWLDRLLGKNPYCPIKFATFESAAYYSFQRVMERVNNKDAKGNGDFLDNFLEAKETHPDIVGDNEVVSYLMLNVLAGADTTAIVTKAIVWYILSTPGVQEKLGEELLAAQLTFPCKYAETRELPYLNACIREGMRMHPVISGILERIVPSGGMTLPEGRFIAPGTKVGINPWVSSRNEEVFGKDADSFRPERWLQGADEDEEEFADRLKSMNSADFTFGSGNRQCTGRNMATVELHKIVSTIFSRYDVSFSASKTYTVIIDLVVDQARYGRTPMVATLVVVYLHRQHQGQVHPSARHCRHPRLANTDKVVCGWGSPDLEFWRLAGVSLQACYLPAQTGTKIGSLMLHVINWTYY